MPSYFIHPDDHRHSNTRREKNKGGRTKPNMNHLVTYVVNDIIPIIQCKNIKTLQTLEAMKTRCSFDTFHVGDMETRVKVH